jgi:transposase
MEVKSEELKQSLLPLRSFIDVDAEMTGKSEIETFSLTKHHHTGKDLQNVRPVKVRGSYRRYTAFQTEKLFEVVIEAGKTAKDAALMIGISIRTAQHNIKKYHDDEEKFSPVAGNKKFSAGPTNKLAEQHSNFLVEYIDERPAAVLSKIKHHVYQAFPGLTISISAL